MIDLGSGFKLELYGWSPERTLNPQFDDIPDAPAIVGILTCKHGLEGSIHLDIGEAYKRVFNGPWWTVNSWEPLTLSPSIDCGCCHGFIREGKWVDA